MDLYYDYDEDLGQNLFFQKLQSDHKIILETAPLENWIICIPRMAVLPQCQISDPNFVLCHILIPNDELPTTHFTTLLGEDFTVSNKILQAKSNMRATILFEEIFYTKGFKYKVWCIDCPLVLNECKLPKSMGIFVVRDLIDATELLRNESNSMGIFRRIDSACRSFVQNNSKRMKRLPKLKANVDILYSHCLDNLMVNRRLRDKCHLDVHFCKVIKIALETYCMNEIYGFLFDAISICRLEESEQFNKIIRNLSDMHLSQFNIDCKHNDILTIMRMELLKIENYRTAVEKLGCLRRALNAVSRNKHINLSVDEIIPILVFVIIKSSLTHWIGTLTFLRDFIFTDITDASEKGADSFLITTLEAAISYIKSIDYNRQIECGFEIEPTENTEKEDKEKAIKEEFTKTKFNSKEEFMDHLLKQIRNENEKEVIRLLKKDNHIEFELESESTGARFVSESHLCHPLCDCETCTRQSTANQPNVNIQNRHGLSALHAAAMYGSTIMLNLIIALEADINCMDENNWTALHYAALRGHQNTLLLLLHAGININAKNMDQCSALHLAALNGHSGCVKALIYYSDHMRITIDVNGQNKMGDTPLHSAARWGFTEICETLLEGTANVECVNRLGRTALHYAHNSIITHLLQNSFVVIDRIHLPDPPPTDDGAHGGQGMELYRGFIRDELMYPSSPTKQKTKSDKIIAAIKNDDLKLAYHFMGCKLNCHGDENSGDIDHHPLCDCDSCKSAQSTGEAATTSEAANNKTTIIDFNANEIASDGMTIMHAAAKIGNIELIQFLLKHDASVNMKNASNETVLHLAVDSQNLEMVELILSQINEKLINEQDSNGQTALHRAVEKCNNKMVALLLAHDADASVKSNIGQTAMDIAKTGLFFNIIKMLEDNDKN